MSRLPTPGADDGSWGSVLNDYLLQAHNSDGSLKSSAISVALGTLLQSVPVYLTWTGTDYAPVEFKATTSRPKIFSGPTDPATVSGVVFGAYDEWNQTTS